MIKCRVDSRSNIWRRTTKALKNTGKILLLVGAVLGVIALIVWIAIVTDDWLGWWWVGAVAVTGMGTVLLMSAYSILHWIICVDEKK